MENIKGTTNGGGSHGTLSKKGIRQAKAVAQKLKSKKIAAIYSSDLQRAMDTARYIANLHNLPVHHTKSLREMNYGPFEGHKFTPKAWRTLKTVFYDPKIKIKGVESFNEAHSRVHRFIATVSRQHKNDEVVFVSHSGISRIITATLREMPIEKVRKVPRLGNARIRYFRLD
jgi:broad specificity phosphatase PhoE